MNRLDNSIKIFSVFAVLITTLWIPMAIITLADFSIAPSFVIFTNSAEELCPNTLPLNHEKSAKMLFFGDLMLDRHVKERIDKYGLEYLFINLASSTELDLNDFDLVGANLEGVLTIDGAHYAPVKSYDFAFSPDSINGMKKYNFNFFNIANNHLDDQGERGIIETRENLDELGYFYVGCPDGHIGDCSQKIVPIAGRQLGMIGFSMVYSRVDIESLLKQVGQLASSTDLVIANIHWGREYEHYASITQKDIAHQLIDAGVDIIIGHHPHVVQGVEIYKEKLIFYSLGNFIFDQYFSPDTQEGLALEFNIDNNEITTVLHPFKSKLSQLVWLSEEEKKNFYAQFISWSNLDNEYKEKIKSGKIIL